MLKLLVKECRMVDDTSESDVLSAKNAKLNVIIRCIISKKYREVKETFREALKPMPLVTAFLSPVSANILLPINTHAVIAEA